VKIATWNVNSVLARLPLVLRWLDEARPDVLCLQELKCTDERFPAAEFAGAGYKAAVNGQPTYNGVAILSRQPLEDVRRGMPGDEEGAHARVITATVGGVKVVNVYVPNGQAVGTDKYKFKLEWLKRLRAYLDEEFWADDEVLICGDFNVAPEDRDVHDPVQWRGRILFSKPERDAIEEVRDWGFTDAFRLHNDGGGHFSWWDYRSGSFPRNTGLRIDHVWVSEPLAERCKRSWIDREPRGWERPSDHTPVVAEFSKV
jgi:exodeoxyribonuclease-3